MTDSAKSHRIIYDCDLLENYELFTKQIVVTTTSLQDGESLSEGNLSIMMKFSVTNKDNKDSVTCVKITWCNKVQKMK